METLAGLQSAFDIVLGLTLLWLAWRALTCPELFKAIVLFIAFGLLMALAWVRLDALDIALAEAAIGAGLTGALLLAALTRLGRSNSKADHAIQNASSEPSDSSGNRSSGPLPHQIDQQTPLPLLPLLLVLLFAIVLAAALISLPAKAPGLSEQVAANLATSGVSNPVTAVLINFRGYDTLLEMAVLLLALLGVWSLGTAPEPQQVSAGEVLELLPRLLVPVLIVVAGYLLWDGGHAPGGAFQAGAVLGAVGVLLLLAGWHLGARFTGLPQRIALIAGLGTFVAVGVASMLIGGRLLEYPVSLAAGLILFIEAVATLSIGITLADLFLGGRPPDEVEVETPAQPEQKA